MVGFGAMTWGADRFVCLQESGRHFVNQGGGIGFESAPHKSWQRAKNRRPLRIVFGLGVGVGAVLRRDAAIWVRGGQRRGVAPMRSMQGTSNPDKTAQGIHLVRGTSVQVSLSGPPVRIEMRERELKRRWRKKGYQKSIIPRLRKRYMIARSVTRVRKEIRTCRGISFRTPSSW